MKTPRCSLTKIATFLYIAMIDDYKSFWRERFQGFRDFLSDPASFPFRKFRLWLLAFYVLTMPLVIYLPNTEYGYTKTIYTVVYISFLLFLWAGEALVHRRMSISFTSLSIPFSILLLVGFASIISAASVGTVLQSLAMLVYFFFVYLLIANTVRSVEEAKILLIAILLAAFSATIYGGLQYLGVVRGKHGLSPRVDNIITTMGNQNYLAGFLAYLFFPGVGVLVLAKGKVVRGMLAVVLAFTFVILFPIGARGAWLALVVSALFFLTGVLWFSVTDQLRDNRKWILFLLVLLALAYLFVGAPSPLNSVVSLPEDSSQSLGSWGALSPVIQPLITELVKKGGARVEDWYVAWEMLKDHPFFGVGLGNYKIKFLDYRARFLQTPRGENFGEFIPRAVQAHNEYVQFVAELGLVGCFAILFSFVFLLWAGLKRIFNAQSQRARLLGIVAFSGCLGFLAHSTVSFPLHLPASSLSFILLLGILHSPAVADSQFEVTFRPPDLYFLLVPVLIFAVTISVFAYRDWRANILMNKGVTQMKYGNYHLARDYLQDSLIKDFQPRHTYYYLGVVERNLGNSDRALEYFTRSTDQFVDYKLYLHLGTLWLEEEEYEKARSALKHFISTGPKRENLVEAKYFLAVIDLRQGKPSEAEEMLEQVLEEDPKYHRAEVLMGDIASSRGNPEQALEHWEKALDIIQSELDRITDQLQGDLSLDRYSELTERKEFLTQQKEQVQDKVDQYRN
ncbi:MAG: O-antigen ligase family protein [Candidatus Acetothermia bacterium]